MKKSLLFLTFGSLLILFFGVCSRSRKVDESEIRPKENTPSGPTLLFILDGSIKDWSGIEPIWNEGGAEGRGAFEHYVDIKQVYFKNDDRYLYVFMRCTPTVVERYKIHPYSGDIGDLYFDIDDDPATGSGKVLDSDVFKGEKYRGYEVKVWIPIGVFSSSGRSIPYTSYEVRLLENEKFSVQGIYMQKSFDEDDLIAHGPDGIELALPLDKLGIKTRTTIRVLLKEASHFSEEEGYSVGSFNLASVQE
jgi:hypothetical protein